MKLIMLIYLKFHKLKKIQVLIIVTYLELTFQLKFNGEFTNLNCTFETFDTTMNILNSSYTLDQIKQIKIHLLLNLYDENEDCSCRLWCLKKLLSYN